MELRKLKELIEQECGEFLEVYYGKKDWLIIKTVRGKRTFSSIRMGVRIITVNIDSKADFSLKDIVAAIENFKLVVTHKGDHIQNKVTMSYEQVKFIPSYLNAVYNDGKYDLRTDKDRTTTIKDEIVN